MIDTIEVEKEVFLSMLDRIDFLHKTISALYDKLRDRRLSEWLTTEQTCDFLHISERKLRLLKERGKIGYSHLGRLSQFKGSDVAGLITVGKEIV